MRKFLKYVLMVAALILACATIALAADGDPVVAIVNGQPFSSLEEAFSASSPGSTIALVSDTTISSTLNVPYGATFNIPSGVSLHLDNVGVVLKDANMNVYGNVISARTGQYGAITVQNNCELNVYGGIISSSTSETGIYCSTTLPNGVVNIYSGRIQGFLHSINVPSSWSGSVNVYGGEFFPQLDNFRQIHLMNGAYIVPGSGNTAVSWGGLFEIGQIVSEAISWIGLFCAAIVANKLLLIFIIFVFGFVGLGLIKRIFNN